MWGQANADSIHLRFWCILSPLLKKLPRFMETLTLDHHWLATTDATGKRSRQDRNIPEPNF